MLLFLVSIKGPVGYGPTALPLRQTANATAHSFDL